MPEDDAPPTEAPPKTTTSGAQAFLQTNAWLTAAAVAVYTTKALWIKLREMGLGKRKGKEEDAGQDKTQEGSMESVFDEPQPPGLVETQVVNICPI